MAKNEMAKNFFAFIITHRSFESEDLLRRAGSESPQRDTKTR